MWGSGIGLGLRVLDLGFIFQGWGFGSRVQDVGFRIRV